MNFVSSLFSLWSVSSHDDPVPEVHTYRGHTAANVSLFEPKLPKTEWDQTQLYWHLANIWTRTTVNVSLRLENSVVISVYPCQFHIQYYIQCTFQNTVLIQHHHTVRSYSVPALRIFLPTSEFEFNCALLKRSKPSGTFPYVSWLPKCLLKNVRPLHVIHVRYSRRVHGSFGIHPNLRAQGSRLLNVAPS